MGKNWIHVYEIKDPCLGMATSASGIESKAYPTKYKMENSDNGFGSKNSGIS